MTAPLDKWNKFYEDASSSNTCPPWESSEPFSGLVDFAESNLTLLGSSAIELGCGASASAVYLAEKGLECTALDLSPLAIERARTMPKGGLVRWIVADILDPVLCAASGPVTAGSFDFVLDMQCFHVLRTLDEPGACAAVVRLLRPGGHAMVVTGARSEEEPPLVPGPPALSQKEVVGPFTTAGLELQFIRQTRFNNTPHYQTRDRPPLAWVAVFRKPAESS